MAFIVETGEGLSNATSFASVEYADSYFSTRGITEWFTLSDSVVSDGSGSYVSKEFVATEGQTEFDVEVTMENVSVYRNGIKLSDTVYTFEGTVVTLNDPCSEYDVVSITVITAGIIESTLAKETALVRATDYINVSYYFNGYLHSSTQALQWPRDYAYDKDGNLLEGVPEALKKATVELALIALSDNSLINNYDNDGRIIREKVDGAVEVEYSSDGYKANKSFVYVDRLLTQFGVARSKAASGGNLRIVRV